MAHLRQPFLKCMIATSKILQEKNRDGSCMPLSRRAGEGEHLKQMIPLK